MIRQETAEKIWCCYREIAASEKLLKDIADSHKECDDDEKRYAGTLQDAYGRRRNLQLGVPSGIGAHTLYDVSPKLAESCILAHIANKRAELVEANERARMECET